MKEHSSEPSNCYSCSGGIDQDGKSDNTSNVPSVSTPSVDGDVEKHDTHETIVWLRCDVYDTGIGIPENAIPSLFRKYMQVSADHARKYGGTGLGLAICKQLVELMGGCLTVTSQEHSGSTFTFLLPYKVSLGREPSDEPSTLSDTEDREVVVDANNDDKTACFFHFEPRTLGSLFSSDGSTGTYKKMPKKNGYDPLKKLNILSEQTYSFPSSNCFSREIELGNASPVSDATVTGSEPGSSLRQEQEQEESNVDKHSNLNGLVLDLLHCRKTCMEIDDIDTTSKILDRRRRHEYEKPDRSPHTRSRSSLELASPKSNSKPKILLVEDNKINVIVTNKMMKQLGHSIEVVNNGVEAVHAVQSHTYDLILMDVQMPVMNGLQATRLIRSFEETGNWGAAIQAGVRPPEPSSNSLQNGLDTVVPCRRRIPIIAMTANAMSESAEECLANGMDSFVSKPVTAQKLKECLQQYIPC